MGEQKVYILKSDNASLSVPVGEKAFCLAMLNRLSERIKKTDRSILLTINKSVDEITAVKIILNKWLFKISGGKSQLVINNVFDKKTSIALEAFSVVYGISRLMENSITEEHIRAFRDLLENRFSYGRTEEGEKYCEFIKKYGLSKGADAYNNWENKAYNKVRIPIENGKAGEKIEVRVKKPGKTRTNLNTRSSIFYNPLVQKARKNLIKTGFNFNADKICWKAVEMRDQYDIRPDELINIIAEAASKYKINPALIAAVIEVESQWNSRAKSKHNANNLMQVKIDAKNDVYETFGNDHNYDKYDTDARQNILCGTGYLKICLDKLDGDKKKAVAGYNAGWVKIQQEKGIPDGKKYRETIEFQRNVIALYEKYCKKT